MIHRMIALAVLVGAAACNGGDAAEDAELRTVVASATYACGSMGGPLLCWGRAPAELFGGRSPLLVPTLPSASPALVQVEGPVVDYGAHGCGLEPSGRAWCWGSNRYGALGRPLGESAAAAPVPVATDLRFRDIATFPQATCAVTTAGELYCWGAAWELPIIDRGALPVCQQVPFGDRCSPVPLRIALPVDSEEIIASMDTYGYPRACVRSTAGEARCWGHNVPIGSLGVGDILNEEVPVPTPVVEGHRFEQLRMATNSGTACGLVRGSGIHCWGENATGLLEPIGDLGPSDWISEPTRLVPPEGVVFEHVALGAAHACALDAEGAAWCWGQSGVALGTASELGSEEPVEALGGLRFSTLDTGNGFTCGITSSGAWCWGANGDGQVGDGTTIPQFIPVRVAGQKRLDD